MICTAWKTSYCRKQGEPTSFWRVNSDLHLWGRRICSKKMERVKWAGKWNYSILSHTDFFSPRNSSCNEGPVLSFFLSLVEAGVWLIWDKSTFSFLWSQRCQLKRNLQESAARLGWICHAGVTHLSTAPGPRTLQWQAEMSKIPWFLWFSLPCFSVLLGALALFCQELPNLSKWVENCILNKFCSRRKTYQAVVQGPSLQHICPSKEEGHLSKNKIIEYLGAAIFIIYCLKLQFTWCFLKTWVKESTCITYKNGSKCCL